MASKVVHPAVPQNPTLNPNFTQNPNIALNPKVVDVSASRSYASDLFKNLDMQPVSNPGYICQQKFSQCGHLKSPQDRQQCESFWNNICQNDKI